MSKSHSYQVSLATIGICVFVRQFRLAHFLFYGDKLTKHGKITTDDIADALIHLIGKIEFCDEQTAMRFRT